jgi:hypothetical protein
MSFMGQQWSKTIVIPAFAETIVFLQLFTLRSLRLCGEKRFLLFSLRPQRLCGEKRFYCFSLRPLRLCGESP